MFLVTWTGGYDAPSLALRKERIMALDLSDNWFMDAEDGDMVAVYRIHEDGMLTPVERRIK